MIRNIDDLEKVLSSRIIQAMKLTEDKIFKVISEKIIEYYNEPVFNNELDPTEPVYYQRTGQLLEELTASHPRVVTKKYKSRKRRKRTA